LVSDARGGQFIFPLGVRATRLTFEISNLGFQILPLVFAIYLWNSTQEGNGSKSIVKS